MIYTTDGKGTKDFYDEFHGVTTSYKTLYKKPASKVTPLTVRLVKHSILLACPLLLLIVLYFLSYERFALFVIAFGAAVEFVLMCFLFVFKRLIKQQMSKAVPTEVTIDETGIQFNNDNGIVKMNWENTKCVLINRYTIVFLPNDKNSITLAVGIEDKEKILEGLTEVNKMDLVVDNSELYK